MEKHHLVEIKHDINQVHEKKYHVDDVKSDKMHPINNKSSEKKDIVITTVTTNIAESIKIEVVREDLEITKTEESGKTFYATKMWKEAHSFFNWNDFSFSLIFGLVPTVWDVSTDIWLGEELSNNADQYTSGLCYCLVCLPAILLIKEMMGKILMSLQSKAGKIMSYLIVCIYMAIGPVYVIMLGVMLWIQPMVFKYPAIILSATIVGIKTLAVFIHTPQMQKLSLKLSDAECTYESSLQVLLLLFTWLSGGKMYLGCMISSILVIGKVGSENLLIKGRENKLKDKPFVERLCLVAKFIPVMALTAIFRLCSAALCVYPTDLFLPYKPIISICLAVMIVVPCVIFFIFVFHLLKPWYPRLMDLSLEDISQGILGECTTITVWEKLGRENSRGVQMGTAVFFLIKNSIHIYWLYFEYYKCLQAGGIFSMWQTLGMESAFPNYCIFVLFSGMTSYLLAFYQVYLPNT